MSILIPIQGHTGLYRDPDSGRVVNIRDFNSWSVSLPVVAAPWPTRGVAGFTIPEKEMWIIQHWGFILEPWTPVEVRHTAVLRVDDDIQTQGPLCNLVRSNDKESALEKRVARLEKAMSIKGEVDGHLHEGHLCTWNEKQEVQCDIRPCVPEGELHLILSGLRWVAPPRSSGTTHTD